MMKPRVFLDSSLPKTSRVPLDAVGEIDDDLLMRLVDLSAEFHYSESDDDAHRAAIMVEYNALKAGVTFEERPHFVEIRLIGGSLSGLPAEMPEMISCHPETWKLATDEMKAKYEVIEENHRMRGQTINIANLPPASQEVKP